eukprot:6192346-Pleurochrysis_carterae.AAC.4
MREFTILSSRPSPNQGCMRPAAEYGRKHQEVCIPTKLPCSLNANTHGSFCRALESLDWREQHASTPELRARQGLLIIFRGVLGKVAALHNTPKTASSSILTCEQRPAPGTPAPSPLEALHGSGPATNRTSSINVAGKAPQPNVIDSSRVCAKSSCDLVNAALHHRVHVRREHRELAVQVNGAQGLRRRGKGCGPPATRCASASGCACAAATWSPARGRSNRRGSPRRESRPSRAARPLPSASRWLRRGRTQKHVPIHICPYTDMHEPAQSCKCSRTHARAHAHMNESTRMMHACTGVKTAAGNAHPG